ncbi:hypothetical protein GGP41_000601 [Bipolaris sorokiniana]|uniref:Uncharacterized protein n=1 Tax=Cochliobolus sativus TaxID=45130 RepID=A0A8H5ZPG8_COCSA|nr:hypothetical protein GGP41_000601 [Bipolaris sorokiniana]
MVRWSGCKCAILMGISGRFEMQVDGRSADVDQTVAAEGFATCGEAQWRCSTNKYYVLACECVCLSFAKGHDFAGADPWRQWKLQGTPLRAFCSTDRIASARRNSAYRFGCEAHLSASLFGPARKAAHSEHAWQDLFSPR